MSRHEKDIAMLGAAHALKGLCADRFACHAGTLEPTDCPLVGICYEHPEAEALERWELPDLKKED